MQGTGIDDQIDGNTVIEFRDISIGYETPKYDDESTIIERETYTPKSERSKSSPVKPYDDAEMYRLECSREGRIPIGLYITNINEKSLSLCYANIGPEDFQPLSASLARNHSITVLNLNHNSLGDEGVSILCQLFADNTNFTKISLADNKISCKRAEPFFDSLSALPNLTSLDLSENSLDDSSAAFVADLLLSSPSLEYLNLSRNKFSENSTVQFGRGLESTETLKELDISWNSVCGSGKSMKQFARGLGVSKLQKLNYSFNKFGPTEGCKELVQALKSNRYLEELDMSDNLISPQGCVILSKGLAANKSLLKIKFARNPFQSAGCFALLSGLLKNRASRLQELNFEDISVNEDFKILVDKAFKILPELRVIHGSRLGTVDQEIYSLKMYAPSNTEEPKRWMTAIRNLQKKTNRPILPFLIEADRDKDMKLSHLEATQALELYFRPSGISLTPEELKGLLKELDPFDENEVNINDLVEHSHKSRGNNATQTKNQQTTEAPSNQD